MHSLAQRVLVHIRRQELLRAGDRVGVAVSGGIDSVALLRLLLELHSELGIVLSVVHFNHKLRGAESDGDEQFAASLAREHSLEFFAESDDVAGHARDEGVSLEAAARELRYGFFSYLLGAGDEPRGLTPHSWNAPSRGPEGPLFHGNPNVEAGAHKIEVNAHKIEAKIPTSGNTGQKWGTHLTLNLIATGHTLDDQAETVLMHLIRGSGLRGLGAIHPRITVENDRVVGAEIIRPLLAVRRRELEQYLKDIGQPWREDATNSDPVFTRNRVRKLLVPLLEKEFNPAVAENLSELAEIARGEEDYWENEVAGWMGTGVHWSEPEWARPDAAALVQIHIPLAERKPQELKPLSGVGSDGAAEGRALSNQPAWLVMNASVDRLWFLGEPIAVQRRVIKAIGEQAGIPLEFKHVEEVLHCAAGDGQSNREISLPLGWKVVREADQLLFLTPDLREPAPFRDYEYELSVPGRVVVSEAGSLIETRRIPAGSGAYNPDHLLDADSLPRPLWVRNWRAGDRFWPAHTKSPKKIKELLQERHVAQSERKSWPVVVSGNEIVWLRGFKSPRKFQAKPGRDAVMILESPLAHRSSETESGPPVRGGAHTS